MADFMLRNAVAGDAEGLAQLHVDVWRQTYADLAPQAAYQKLDQARRLPYWRATVSGDDPSSSAIVATDGTIPQAVVSFGKPNHPALKGSVEIKHCYVRRSAQGQGLGRLILQEVFERLRATGHPDAVLAVVEENAAARRFYRSMGGREVGRFTDPGPLWRSRNCVVRWQLDPDYRREQRLPED